MTNITLHPTTTVTKHGLFKNKHKVTLYVNGKPTGISKSGLDSSEAFKVSADMQINVEKYLDEADISRTLRNDITAERLGLPALPGLGEQIELTIEDFANVPKGTLLRVVSAEYSDEILNPENQYPVTAVPEEEFWGATAGAFTDEEIQKMTSIPLNPDEYLVLGYTPRAVMV